MALSDAKQDDQWISALEYLRCIQSTWNATVVVEVTSDGSNYAQTCYVKVKATIPRLTKPGEVIKVEKFDRWPRLNYRHVGSLVYHLLHEVDREIGGVLHKQQELPF